MNDSVYIYPIVKKTIAALAATGGWLLIICLILAVMEIVLAMGGFIENAINCGSAAQFLFFILLSILGILTLWSHSVLLGDRGVIVSHFFCIIGIPFIILLPITQAYSIITNDELIENQAFFPYFVCVIILQAAILNIPKMAAAPLSLRWRIALFPLMILGVAITDFPGLLPIALLFKIGATALGSGLLFRLSGYAPRIINMPEKHQKPTVNE